MNYEFIQTQINPQGLATLTLNRPKLHNAFNDQFLDELVHCLSSWNRESKIKLLSLEANGKSFCAGADLNWMKSMSQYSFAENIADSHKLALFFKILDQFPVPVLAKVQGAVYGGGLGILACADFVMADHETKYCFSEVKLGLAPAVISPFVMKKIGLSQARAYFLTAKVFRSKEALHMGLVHESSDQLDQDYPQLLTHCLKLAPQAMRSCKSLIKQVDLHHCKGTIHDRPPLEDLVCETIATLRSSQEGQEGMKALLEKREARY